MRMPRLKLSRRSTGTCRYVRHTFPFTVLDLTLCRAVIHPDKTKHERAPEAFDILKKVYTDSWNCSSDSFTTSLLQAESELSDKTKREELDALIAEARLVVLKANSLPSTTQDDDPKLKALNPPFRVQLRVKTKELLIEEEVRRRKCVR